MPFSRRLFLTTASALHMTALYSPSAFGEYCYAPQIRHCPVPMPPYEYLSKTRDENSIETFLNEKYGPNAWSYSLSQISFRAPELPENKNSIPVEVRCADPGLAGRYRSLAIYMQQLVQVWDAENFFIRQHIFVKHMISRVAEYKLGEQVIPDISMRLRAEGASQIEIFAIFTPVDRSQRIEVVKHKKSLPLLRCHDELHVYVNGKWPEGPTLECMENI